MYILGIIPARAGSKGIPYKNIQTVNGKALISYSIEAALDSKIDVTVVTSDIPTIDMYIPKGKIKAIKRPAELCGDDVPMLPVIQDAIKQFEKSHRTKHPDIIVLLQPTSPLRTAEDIDEAITLYKEKNASCLYSGYYMGIKTNKPYDKHTAEKHFQRNGAIFITSCDLIDQGKLWDETAIRYEMPKSRSIDIDDMDDMKMAEALLQYKFNGGLL